MQLIYIPYYVRFSVTPYDADIISGSSLTLHKDSEGGEEGKRGEREREVTLLTLEEHGLDERGGGGGQGGRQAGRQGEVADRPTDPRDRDGQAGNGQAVFAPFISAPT